MGHKGWANILVWNTANAEGLRYSRRAGRQLERGASGPRQEAVVAGSE